MLYVLLLFLAYANAEKFCIHCKHFKNSLLLNPVFGECRLYSKDSDNNLKFLISGFPKKENHLCLRAREDENMCGPTAKNYETKYRLLENLNSSLLSKNMCNRKME